MIEQRDLDLFNAWIRRAETRAAEHQDAELWQLAELLRQIAERLVRA